jgi:AcrR family transcriptional regulator
MPTKKDLQSEMTQRQLIDAARPLFAQRGYAEIGTEEIVQAAGMTRGALYHHYRNKEELFTAVVEDVIRDMHAEILAAAGARQGDAWDSLERGISAFLTISQRPEVLRIVFRDAPSVLGWQRWRELDAKYGLGLLQSVLTSVMEAGLIAKQPAQPLAHLLLGALIEAAMMIGNSADPMTTRGPLEAWLGRLLAGLRTAPPKVAPTSRARTTRGASAATGRQARSVARRPR